MPDLVVAGHAGVCAMLLETSNTIILIMIGNAALVLVMMRFG